MSDWPRFQITPEEARFSSKYEDPRTNKQRVLRRIYTNEYNLSADLRRDSNQFQISRRCRVFGLTAAGDIDRFLVELKDSTGEQYTAGPVHLANLLKGWSSAPYNSNSMNYPVDDPDPVVATVEDRGPFIQEPNIVLAPNQTLNIDVSPADLLDDQTSLRVEISLHVYEFPGMPGSPL